ncbi:MAG: CpsD/CapB family tyrosine-protein kinase [Verrucomicrobiales bacterium]
MISNRYAARFDWADCLQAIRARWSLVVLIVSIVLVSGAAIRWRFPQMYRASAEVELLNRVADDPVYRRSTEVQASALNRLGREMAEMKSRSLLADVVRICDLVDRWKLGSAAHARALLRDRLEVRRGSHGSAFIIEVQDVSKEGAAELANALGERFVSRKSSAAVVEANRRAAELAGEARNQRESMEALERRLLKLNRGPESGGTLVAELRRQLISGNHLLRALEARHQAAMIDAHEKKTVAILALPADPAAAVALGNLWLTLGGLILAGAFLGSGVVALGALGKGRWAVAGKLGEKLDLTVTGFTPVTGTSFMKRVRPAAPVIEPYRDLRTKIDRLPAADCMFLTLLPEGENCGLAEALVNLAAVHADGGHTVLVIDADLRDPRLHECFEAARHPGLSDYLSGEMRLEETILKTRRNNLWFMPSGPMHDDPCGLVAGRRMKDLVWNMRSRFDYIIVASPSIHQYSEAGALVEYADHTVVVAPYRDHTTARLRKTKHAVEAASGVLSAAFLSYVVETDEPSYPVVRIKPETGSEKAANTVELDAAQPRPAFRIRRSRHGNR